MCVMAITPGMNSMIKIATRARDEYSTQRCQEGADAGTTKAVFCLEADMDDPLISVIAC
jgi:hypothetical protein